MPSKPTWTDEMFREAVRTSTSMRALMQALGLAPIGGNYLTMKTHIARLGLCTEHFHSQREQAKAQGRLGFTKLTRDEALERFRVGIHYSSTHKAHLPRFKDSSKCSECGLGREWNGKPLVLQVDHINGDCTDNRLDNLRYICPNCHTQTDTFAGRRFRIRRVSQHRVRPPRPGKIAWPDRDTLQHMVTTVPTSVLAQQLGVSDQAIAKRCARLGITKPGRGHWAKHRPHGETLEDTPASETGAK